MQNTYLITVLLAFITVAAGCGKDATISGNSFIQGNWELLSRSGGITGASGNYAPGNGNTYTFTNDSYKKYTNSQPVKNGTYTTVQDSSLVLHQPATRIIFDHDENTIRTLVSFKPLRMTITEDVYDGYTYVYRQVLTN